MPLTKVKPDIVDTTQPFTFTGHNIFARTSDTLQSLSNATGTVTHDISSGAVFYHTTPSANWTANFTNVPTDNNRTVVVSIVIIQGTTARIPSAVQIAGSAQTINWLGGTAPTGNANKRDIVSFTLIRVSSAWTVLGQLSSYG